MARRWSLRKPVSLRVVELLLTRPLIWVIGVAIGLATLVAVTLFELTVGLVFMAACVVAGATVVVFKERVLFVRGRLIVTGEPVSRRQLLAYLLAVAVPAAAMTSLGWMLGGSIAKGYDESIRRYIRRTPSKKTP